MFLSLDEEQEDSKQSMCGRSDMGKFTAHVGNLKMIVQWIRKNSQELVETESRMVITKSGRVWGVGRYCSKGTNFQLQDGYVLGIYVR